jgi:hypothetical protein
MMFTLSPIAILRRLGMPMAMPFGGLFDYGPTPGTPQNRDRVGGMPSMRMLTGKNPSNDVSILGEPIPQAMLNASLLGTVIGNLSQNTLLTNEEPRQATNQAAGGGLRRQSQPMRYAQRPATFEAATRNSR